MPYELPGVTRGGVAPSYLQPNKKVGFRRASPIKNKILDRSGNYLLANRRITMTLIEAFQKVESEPETIFRLKREYNGRTLNWYWNALFKTESKSNDVYEGAGETPEEAIEEAYNKLIESKI
jgi:hypothetical protein